MNHENWDDDKIEKLLSNVPKIHDQRSKDDVLKRLREDGVFDEEPKMKKDQIKKKKFNWLPFVVSAAALVVLAIFIPSFMNQGDKISIEESVPMEKSEMARDIGNDDANITEETNRLFTTQSASLSTAVYPEELEGNTVFQLGLASDAADSVPVTVLIPNEKIQQDFGDVEPTGVDLYNQYAPLFNESAIGFTDYHPYKGSITEEDNEVIHTLPSDQNYDIASAALETYKASIIDTFNYYYEEAKILNEQGAPFEFSEVGQPSEPLRLDQSNTQYNYFEHTQSDGTKYLMPNFRVTYDNVEQAILAMKEETNDIYKTVVLPEVDYNVTSADGLVTITFTKELDLMNYDQLEAMQMIEGMLLTAANFNLQVQFENIVQGQWEGFDFTKPLPIPVAPNEITYSTVFE